MNLLRQFGQSLARFFGESTPFDQMGEELDFLSDQIPYRIYDAEHKIYENQSSFGFVLEIVPLLGASTESQKEIASLIREIGEEGANIQTMIFADHRIAKFLKTWNTPREKIGSLFAKAAQKRIAFLEKESAQGDVPPRVFRCIFSFSVPKPKKQEAATCIARLAEKKKKAMETFSRISSPIEMEPDALIAFVSGIANFDSSTEIHARPWDTQNWISKQICLPGSALEVEADGVLFHGKNSVRMRSYEAIDLPDRWNLHSMGELIGDFLNPSYRLPSPFSIHYGIHFPIQSKVETKFFNKMKILAHQSKFPALVRMFPEMPREMEENLFVQKMLAEGEKFVETRFSCSLWAQEHQFTKAESTLLALFQKYGFKLKENRFIHFPDLLSSLPMAWGEDSPCTSGLKRVRSFRTTLTHETASLLPCVGEWWGNSTQGMLLMGRKGQIASWDPFATDGNLNTVIVGPSGSGKSVFMQEMIMTHLGQGGRVFVLDLGRSFEKLCHLLNGQYLNFSEKSGFDLNPFHAVKTADGVETLNAGLEMVSSIITTMAMPMQKIDKERADILGSLVKAAWEKKGAGATIDTIIELIENTHFHSELMIGAAESVKEGLKKYSTRGAFAHYFYGSRPIDFSQDVVVIETEELKNIADLQAVVLQIFTLAISNQIFMGDRKRRCMICIDEAWDLLKSPQMEGFIESLARRLRKYNGALVVGTQSIKDFERSAGAKAAFQNSNWLVCLGKDSESINTLKKENLIPMSEYKETALNSLRIEGGKYSELFLYHKGSGASAVGQLKLDPFSALLYSTQAEEFQAIASLKERGIALEEAMEWLLEHKVLFQKKLKEGKTVGEAIDALKGPL